MKEHLFYCQNLSIIGALHIRRSSVYLSLTKCADDDVQSSVFPGQGFEEEEEEDAQML